MEIEAIKFKTDKDAAAVIRAMHAQHEKRENELQHEIERLRSALRYYATVKNWRRDDWNVLSIIVPEYGKPGRRARRALRMKQPKVF